MTQKRKKVSLSVSIKFYEKQVSNKKWIDQLRPIILVSNSFVPKSEND